MHLSYKFKYVSFLLFMCAWIRVIMCSTTLDIRHLYQEYLDEIRAKQAKDGIIYDPHHGYEPYWENGDWVFMKRNTPSPATDTTTTAKPQPVCGEACPDQYVHIRQVCGRLISYLSYTGCDNNCWGDELDDFSVGYKTFESFCQFLDEQCHSGFHDRWIFVHGGPCMRQQKQYLKPISEGSQLVSRVPWYFTALSQARASHSLPPINFD